MSIEYIRRYYGVPAKRGMEIDYKESDGNVLRGIIVGARDARLRVRFKIHKHYIANIHPCDDGIKYITNERR